MTANLFSTSCITAFALVLMSKISLNVALNSLEHPLVKRESSANDEEQRIKRVLGGSTTNLDAPYAAAIMHNGELKCSGCIISNRTIITAKSCFQDASLLVDYRIVVGVVEIDSDTWENAIPITGILTRDLPYDEKTIALVFLSEALEFSDLIQAINLITVSKSAESFTSDAPRKILGWGETDLNQITQQLNSGTGTSALVSGPLCLEINVVTSNSGTGSNLIKNVYGCLRSGACPLDVGAPVVYIDMESGENFLEAVLVYLDDSDCNSSRGISVYMNVLAQTDWILANKI